MAGKGLPPEAKLEFAGVTPVDENLIFVLWRVRYPNQSQPQGFSMRFGSHSEAADFLRRIAQQIEDQGP